MIDLTGTRFGKLTVVQDAPSKQGPRAVLCVCDCGNKKVVLVSNLKRGRTKSCGCSQGKRKNKTVADEDKRLHGICANMKTRCNNPNVSAFKYYGDRGIKYCEEWEQWRPFKKWAYQSGYDDSLSIDRIDVNGNYCPENCRWVTKTEQMNNKRDNRIIEYNGEAKTVAQWAKIVGIDHRVMWDRLFKQDMPIEKALSMPRREVKPVRQIAEDGKTIGVFENAVFAEKATGIHRQDIRDCCRGKIDFAGGYKWERISKED